MDKNTIKELENILRNRDIVKIDKEQKMVRAAVMVLLKDEGSGYSILFIKRTENEGDVFSGHMAFPGGKTRAGDKGTLVTAIRETAEETGIDINRSGTVIGELDDFYPNNPKANHYVVTPYISLLEEEVELTLDSAEVADAVWIPIGHLNNPRNQEVRIVETTGRVSEDFVFHYSDYVIWGMTGRILHQFLLFFGKIF